MKPTAFEPPTIARVESLGRLERIIGRLERRLKSAEGQGWLMSASDAQIDEMLLSIQLNALRLREPELLILTPFQPEESPFESVDQWLRVATGVVLPLVVGVIYFAGAVGVLFLGAIALVLMVAAAVIATAGEGRWTPWNVRARTEWIVPRADTLAESIRYLRGQGAVERDAGRRRASAALMDERRAVVDARLRRSKP